MGDLAALVAKDRIVDCITRLFMATDARDWDAVRACLADTVEFDMTSLTGGAPAMLTPRQITDIWEEGLRPMQAMHHQAGNYRVSVEGTTATASCYGIAMHFRQTKSGRNVRTFVGSYDFRLVKEADEWRIALFRFNLKYLDGNRDLETTD